MGNKNHPSLTITLSFVFIAMLVVMSLYELAKQLLNPDITIWESHALTILFTSIISVVILFFPLRSLYREQQRTKDALRHEQEAEEKLRRSEAQYRSFVESAEDSIYTVDRELRYLLINARHLARKGLPPEVYAGKKYEDFHSKEETEFFESQVQQVITSKNSVLREYTRNGKVFLRKLNPVIDPVDNTVVAVTVISADITEQKRAEKNLENMNKKLNLLLVERHYYERSPSRRGQRHARV